MIDLRKGDCLEVMKDIPDESIDVIITSPPYNKAGYEGFIRKRHSKDSWKQRNIDYGENAQNDFMPENEYEEWQIKILNECWRVLKTNGSMFYNHKIRVAKHKGSHPIEWILKSKFTFRQQLVWDRGNSPAVAPIRYLPTTELIFWLTKEPIQPNFYRKKTINFVGEVWKFSAKTNSLHPAPFPIELPNNILDCIDGEDITVLDPFMGIGTTGLSAKLHNMNFIGIELDEKYYEIAKERIENAKLNNM